MSKIDRGIREGNHLPGTERYTKPAEIKALAKFLKTGIETRDALLDLEKDNLATPKEDPRFIKTTELSKTFETIDGKRVEALDTGRIGLDKSSDLSLPEDSLKIERRGEPELSDVLDTINGDQGIELGKSRLDLTDTNKRLEELPGDYRSLGLSEEELKGPELYNRAETIQDKGAGNVSEYAESLISGGSLSSLPGATKEELEEKTRLSEDGSVGLEISKNNIEELPKKVIDGPEKKEIGLSDRVEKGPRNNDSFEGLTKKAELLDDPRKDLGLSEYKERGPKANDPGKLDKTRENLEKPKDLSLGTDSKKIKKPEDRNLSKDYEGLKGVKEVKNLDDFLEKIKGQKENKLSGKVEGLEDTRNINLSGDQEKIEVKEVSKLSGTQEKIQENKVTELSIESDKIQKGEDPKLREDFDSITEKKVSELSGEIEKIRGNEEVSGISEVREKLYDSRGNIELSKESVRIEQKGDPQLSREALTIETPDDHELSTDVLKTRENIISDLGQSRKELQDTRTAELSSRKIEIQEEEVSDLSGIKETLEGQKDSPLSDKIERIQGKTVDSLHNTIENLIGSEEVQLSDIKKEISGKEISGLSGILEDLFDSRGGQELSQERVNISDGFTPSLSDIDIVIQEPREKEVSLSDIQVKEPTEKEVNLSDTIIREPSEREVELSDIVVSEPSEKEVELSDILIQEPSETEVNLSDIIIQEPREIEVSLSDIQVKEPSEVEVSLSDIVIQEPTEKEVSLSDIQVKEPTEKEVNLSDTIIREPSEREVELSDIVVSEPSEKEVELSEITIKEPSAVEVGLSDIQIKEPTEKEVSLSDILKTTEENKYETLWEKKEGRPGELEGRDSQGKTESNFSSYTNASELDWLNLSPEDKNKLSEIKKELAGMGDWGEKVDMYLTNLLSGTIGNYVPESKTEAYKNLFQVTELPKNDPKGPDEKPKDISSLPSTSEKINDSSQVSLNGNQEGVPNYKLGEFNLLGGGLNISKYLRWTAENTIGKIGKGATKSRLITETLLLLTEARDLLEKNTQSRPFRLPGGANALSKFVSQGVSLKGVASTAASMFSDAKQNPYNRPKSKMFSSKVEPLEEWGAPGQTVLDNDADGSGDSGGFFKKLGKKIASNFTGNPDLQPEEKRNFKNDYLRINSVSDASSSKIGNEVSKLFLLTRGAFDKTNSDEFLKEAAKSYRITTPEKFTTTSQNKNYFTLDSNHVWEVVVKPYVGSLNGKKTWLPSFGEIDLENKKAFNITTNYASGWLPITGYELQSKKLTSKELPLFDGNFSYPVSMEMTNELRLTFADDSLKSIRRYFELASKTSVYMSNVHDNENWGDASKGKESVLSQCESDPTVVLEGRIHPALYKNVSFLISIFVLTPQLATIKKCDFLCVIKDFAFEYQGETDAAPTELAVTFSIVGENPFEAQDVPETVAYELNEPENSTPGFGDSVLNNLGGAVGSLF